METNRQPWCSSRLFEAAVTGIGGTTESNGVQMSEVTQRVCAAELGNGASAL
jgi:hypothetical protein